jgi:hypothetical protein
VQRDDCERCGVVFAKLRQPSRSRERRSADDLTHGFRQMILEPERLYIEQHYRHWWEILTNLEQRNEYSVTTGDGRLAGWIVEQGQGLAAGLLRVVAGSHRPFEVAVMTTEKEQVLEFGRRFFFLFSDMEVKLPNGRRIGRVRRRFALLARVYDLEDQYGNVFARISSPLFKIWTFPVIDSAGRQAAMIAKKWSGLGREYFTDADNFGVDFGGARWTPEQKAVVFAATIAIDFDFFENNQQR